MTKNKRELPYGLVQAHTCGSERNIPPAEHGEEKPRSGEARRGRLLSPVVFPRESYRLAAQRAGELFTSLN